MEQILSLISKRAYFFLFIVLEGVALHMLYNNNLYQQYIILSLSQDVTNILVERGVRLKRFFSLVEENNELHKENARLRASMWTHKRNALYQNKNKLDKLVPEDYVLDSSKYWVTTAKVINNNLLSRRNYITINKGKKDGIRPNMALIGRDGIVGKIKYCSEHFSLAYSVLNADVEISSYLPRIQSICASKWMEDDNMKTISLLYVLEEVGTQIGDTVYTSSYNAIFPPNIMIGTIHDIQKESGSLFQKVKVTLSTQFNALQHVYVVYAYDTEEQLELEQRAVEQ